MSFMGSRQEQRYAVLRYIYEFAIERLNDPTHKFGEAEIAEALSCPEQDAKAALNYLTDKYLVEVVSTYDGGNKSYKITSVGIDEIEESLQAPDKKTDHFPAQIFSSSVQNFFGPVGAVPTGSYAQTTVMQTAGANILETLELIERLKAQVAELPQDKQEGAADSLEMLEDELNSQTRNPERIRRSLERLGRMAQSTATFLSQVLTLSQQLKALNLFEK